MMLPEVLVPIGDPDPEAARVKRSRRDWIVDSAFFVLARLDRRQRVLREVRLNGGREP